MDWPLITIIITAYNYAHLLPVALNSVLRQAYPQMEILVLDDASTDATATVMEAYAEDQRIRYIRHTRNLGACENANCGLHLARGRYIALLSADNHWADGFLSILVQTLLARPTIDIAYGRNLSINAHDLSLIPWQYIPVAYTGGGKLFAHLLTVGCFISLDSALVKREVYEKYGVLTNAVAASDLELLLRWAANGLQFAHRPEACCITLVHDGQVSAPEKYVASGHLASDYLTILEYYLRPEYAQQIRGFEYGISRTIEVVGMTLPEQHAAAAEDNAFIPSLQAIQSRLDVMRRMNAVAPREDGVTIVLLDAGDHAALMHSLQALLGQSYTIWEAFVIAESGSRVPAIRRELEPWPRIKLLVAQERELEPLPLKVLLNVSSANTFVMLQAGVALERGGLAKLVNMVQARDVDVFWAAEASSSPLVFRREALDRNGPCELRLTVDEVGAFVEWMRGNVEICGNIEEFPRTFTLP